AGFVVTVGVAAAEHLRVAPRVAVDRLGGAVQVEWGGEGRVGPVGGGARGEVGGGAGRGVGGLGGVGDRIRGVMVGGGIIVDDRGGVVVVTGGERVVVGVHVAGRGEMSVTGGRSVRDIIAEPVRRLVHQVRRWCRGPAPHRGGPRPGAPPATRGPDVAARPLLA